MSDFDTTICNERPDSDPAAIDRSVDGHWQGYLEDADAAMRNLKAAGYRIVKEQLS